MRDDVRESAPEPQAPDRSPATPAAALMAPSAAALARFTDTSAPARAAALAQLQGHVGNRDLARLARGRVLARETAEEKWAKAGPGGEKLYGLLAGLLNGEEIAKLLEKVPDATGDAAKSWGIEAVGLTGDEASKIAKAGAGWAQRAASEWFKGPGGQKFLNAAKTHMGQNADFYYDLITNLAISAVYNAAYLYANGKLDPPNLEKALKLTKDFTLTAGIDLGKLHSEFPVQGARLGFDYKLDKYKVLNFDTKLVTDDKTGYTLQGKYGFKIMDETLKRPEFAIGLTGQYGFDSGIYGAGADLGFSRFGAGYSYLATPGKSDVHKITGNVELIKKALLVKVETQIGGEKGDTVGGGVSGEAGGYDYSAAATWNLTEDELAKLTVHLGYINKDKTFKWLAEFAYSTGEKGKTAMGKAALQKAIKGYVIDIEASGGLKDGSPSVSLYTGLQIPLGKGFLIQPGMGFDYGMLPGGGSSPNYMFTPSLGLGHKEMKGVMPTIGLGVAGGGNVFGMIGVRGTIPGT